MKNLNKTILLGVMCMLILAIATGFTYGIGRVNGYCESGDWNPFVADRVRTDAYGNTSQKLTATAKLQYYDDATGSYKTLKTITATKDYNESGSADTMWVESTLSDSYNIRNNYSGAIYNSGGALDFSTSGYVAE